MAASQDQLFFAEHGLNAVVRGYHAFPIRPRSKTCFWKGWTSFCETRPSTSKSQRWIERFAHYSVGIASGYSVVGIDIDELDAARADKLEAMAELFFGVTPLIRVGQAPKRVLVYAVDGDGPIATRRNVSGVEIIGAGSFFVGFGIHPKTEMPYTWGRESPLTVDLADLPRVSSERVADFLKALALLDPKRTPVSDERMAAVTGSLGEVQNAVPSLRIRPFKPTNWRTDENGRVVDGRDVFLAVLVWRAAQANFLDPEEVTQAAWAEFTRRTDLSRPRHDGAHPWRIGDARSKATALIRSGKLTQKGWRKPPLNEGEHGFWTEAMKTIFKRRVDEAGAGGKLSPGAVKLSHHMLGLVYGAGVCLLSVETLSEATGLSQDGVKRLRSGLRKAGLWRSYQDLGGKGHIACYFPNPAVLDPGAILQPQVQDDYDHMVAISDTMISRGGGQGVEIEASDFDHLVVCSGGTG